MGAKAKFRKTKLGRPFEPGFSLIELLIVFILIVEAIALPSLLASKTAVHPAVAAENVSVISRASVAGGKGLPPTLHSLGGLGTAASRDLVNLMDATFTYTGQTAVTKVGGCTSAGFLDYLVTADRKPRGSGPHVARMDVTFSL